MFEMHFEDGDRILCLKYTGMVTPAVFETHMPTVEEAYAQIKPRRVLLDWRGIEGWAPEVESHVLHIRIQHRDDFDRVAIIGTPKWQEEAGKVDEIMMGEVRFYEPEEEAEAWEWLKAD